MSNKVISIDIGLHTTRICEVDYKKKNPKVYHCISYPTPEDVFEDGFIRNKEKFIEVTKAKIAEANIKSNKVIFTVSSTKIANREVMIPFVKPNRIKDVIEVNASDYFPVEISEYTITYSILEKIVGESGKQLRISVLAAPNQLIKNYYSLAELLGYEVVAIDYLGNSIFQGCKGQVGSGIDMIVQVQEESTLLSIIEGDVLILQRTIQYGTESIINTLINNEYYQVKDEEEAIQQLSGNALINTQFTYNQSEVAATIIEFPPEDIYMREQYAKQSLTESLNHLVNNIIRVLDYYGSKNMEKKIQTIYLTGQGSKIKGFDKLLNNETGIEVKKIEALYGITFDKNIHIMRETQGDYLASIGAAIRPLNFMPKDYLNSMEKSSLVHTRKVVLAGSVIIGVILTLTSYIGYRSELIENQGIKSEIENLLEINAIYEAHAIATDKYTQVKSLYDMTISPNENLNELIEELEGKLPKKATVISMNVTESDFALQIKGDSKVTAAKVLQQLKAVSNISQISTSGITQTEDEHGIVTVQFLVTGKHNTIELQEDNNGDHQ